MSAKSDQYEKDVANYINSLPNVQAERPSVGVDYPDVRIKFNNKETWLEVKMNHTDNLANPRVFYNGTWNTTYKTPVAAYIVSQLNLSAQTKKFIIDLSKYTGIPVESLKLPTTKGEYKKLQGNGAVPVDIMKSYFNKPGVNRYILNKQNENLGELVTAHYTSGKKQNAGAYYMQAGDDFYMISHTNPLKLNNNIPLLVGIGDLKVRISTRTEFYEIQPEIKINKMPNSAYSVKPGTMKINPFIS